MTIHRYALAVGPGELRDEQERAAREAGADVLDVDDHPARCLAALERSGATHLVVPAAVLAAVCADPAAALTDLDAVRVVVVDGPEPAGVRETFRRAEVRATGAAPQPSADPVAAAVAAGESTVDPGLTAERSRELVRLLDTAVRGSMLRALQAGGVLVDATGWHTSEQILAANRVATRHHALVRRWLDVLVDAGVLVRDGELLRGTGSVSGGERAWDAAARAWDAAERAWADGFGAPAFVGYLRANAERLGELATGELAAVTLLFPQGRSDIADAVYRDTVTARYLNAAIAAAVAAPAPRRVLEVGGGTAATTEVVLGSLPPGVDYLFTDVTAFFLDAARRRFGARPGLRLAVLDVDGPLDADPAVARGRTDVVVAAGVLNAAVDARATVARLARVLAPGGWLLVSEPTREHLEILTSQAFMMAPPRDDRARTATTFLTVAQWAAVFTGAGLDLVATLPAEDHPLAPLGQRLFLVRRGHETSTRSETGTG